MAVNPYQILSIFTKEKIANFQQTTFENELKPHIFATAKIAHYQLTSLLKSQSILIRFPSISSFFFDFYFFHSHLVENLDQEKQKVLN